MLYLKIMHYLGNAQQKNNNTLIDNVEDLDIVMPIYNLFEYIHRYDYDMMKFVKLLYRRN